MSLNALVLPTVLYKTNMEDILRNISQKDLNNVLKSLNDFKNILQNVCDNEGIYGPLHLLFSKEVHTMLTIF